MLGILGAIITGLLKTAKPEFAVFATIATGMVIVISLLSSITKAVGAFNAIIEKSGIDDALFEGVLKIIGIGYLTEFAANICTDSGCGFIAAKINIAGKVTIFLMSVSIITALIGVIETIVNLNV
jgi:stage III sporulation protein AD